LSNAEGTHRGGRLCAERQSRVKLLCLVELDPADEGGVRGDEPRSVIDNWFRSDRRIREMHDGMRKGRRPLPVATNLYRNLDIAVMTRPFTEWCAATGAAEPDPEAG